MKKVKVDFDNYLTPQVINAIAIIYKDGFKESDVIKFSKVDVDIEDRTKLIFNKTVFLIKKSTVKDVLEGKYEEDFMIPTNIEDETCEGDYCEN
tara:strand:+ start:9679 stop:9960 length:282 start_codon:yes stop_codon:yes gene_type:complete